MKNCNIKYRKIFIFLLLVLLIPSFSYAINFMPEENYNSVVVVYTETGLGSGFLIKENIIVTNEHVVSGYKKITVNLYDGTIINGRVIKTDADKDLALIEVDENLVPLNINEGEIRIGQEVYAIGAPKDMTYTMTKGIVSALDRKLGENIYIQIDASVNSGNSGGPLVDEDGNVIGIITLKVSDAEGIGFAIPIKDVLTFVNGVELSDGEITGNIDVQDNNDQDEDMNLIRISKENELLKMVILILAVLFVLENLIILRLYFKRNKKDDFDFEIEIEE